MKSPTRTDDVRRTWVQSQFSISQSISQSFNRGLFEEHFVVQRASCTVGRFLCNSAENIGSFLR